MMRLLALILIVTGVFTIHAQGHQVFGINSVEMDSIEDEYSFYVSAHFYGGKNNVSGYPASTILGNIDLLNAKSNLFTVCSGDLFRDIRSQQGIYDQQLFSKLNKPLFNAVGNHDVSDGIFEEKYSETSLSFYINTDAHLILDSEKDDGSIKGQQFQLLEKVLKDVKIKNVFIYSHRPLWAEDNNLFDGVFKGNTVSAFGQNFKSEVLPLLQSASKSKQIFWFSGSLGGSAPSSFFYHKDGGLCYIQSAIRDLKRDALLKVKSENGIISFETKSLTGQKLKPLEEYNLEFWQKAHPVKPFNYRLIPLYFFNMLTHRYFWYAVFYTLSGIFIVNKLFKRRRRKLG